MADLSVSTVPAGSTPIADTCDSGSWRLTAPFCPENALKTSALPSSSTLPHDKFDMTDMTEVEFDPDTMSRVPPRLPGRPFLVSIVEEPRAGDEGSKVPMLQHPEGLLTRVLVRRAWDYYAAACEAERPRQSKGKGKRTWDEGPDAEGQQAEGLQGSLVEGNHFIDEGYHEFSESKP